MPRTLDAICERVLNKEASQHALPIETAQEIAAALADYVGEPRQAAPLDPAAMHARADRRRSRGATATPAATTAPTRPRRRTLAAVELARLARGRRS